MTEKEFSDLIERYINDNASQHEKSLLETWYLKQAVKQTGMRYPEGLEAKMEKALPLILANEQFLPKKNIIMTSLWLRWVSAACIAIVVLTGGYFYYQTKNDMLDTGTVYANDIAPGSFAATLTLANGKTIKLSDASNGKLAQEAGVVITKADDGQLVYEIKSSGEVSNNTNTLSTANGETYRLRLPDGSTVWLNSTSSLTYSAGLLKDGKRSVKLNGEGYFQVAKNKYHPFIVETRGQKVEVLGTEFNVNSYTDEKSISTTLVEGSVKVTWNEQQKLIKPGEQVINDGKILSVTKADLENITDWKEGDFNLHRVNFRMAMRKVARWYNVKVVYDADLPDNLVSGGWFSRSQKLSTILKAIEKSGLAKFRLRGDVVYVSKY